MNMGWLLILHQTYTNFNKATVDLIKIIGKDVELELSPHTIFHTMEDMETIWENMLKVVTTSEDSTAVFGMLIEILMVTPREFRTSTTSVFKLIPFQNIAINCKGMMELIRQQNNFLYSTIAMLVVGGGWCDEVFQPERQEVGNKGVIRGVRIHLRWWTW